MTDKGLVIEDYMAINYSGNDKDDYIHFLTHIETGMSNDGLKDIISPTASIIYTSAVNAYILKTHFKCDWNIVAIEFEKTYHVRTKSGIMFMFVCVKSNYNCGSMILISTGDFGTLMYTGYLASAQALLPVSIVQNVIEHKTVSKLYLDCSYYERNVKLFNFGLVRRQMLEFFRTRRHHFYIYVPVFGLEDLLAFLACGLKEKMVVDEKRMAIIELLGLEEFFTLDTTGGRLCVISQSIIKRSKDKDSSELVFINVLNDYSTYQNSYLNNGKIHFFNIYPHCSSEDCDKIVQFTNPEEFVQLYSQSVHKEVKINASTVVSDKRRLKRKARLKRNPSINATDKRRLELPFDKNEIANKIPPLVIKNEEKSDSKNSLKTVISGLDFNCLRSVDCAAEEIEKLSRNIYCSADAGEETNRVDVVNETSDMESLKDEKHSQVPVTSPNQKMRRRRRRKKVEKYSDDDESWSQSYNHKKVIKKRKAKEVKKKESVIAKYRKLLTQRLRTNFTHNSVKNDSKTSSIHTDDQLSCSIHKPSTTDDFIFSAKISEKSSSGKDGIILDDEIEIPNFYEMAVKNYSAGCENNKVYYEGSCEMDEESEHDEEISEFAGVRSSIYEVSNANNKLTYHITSNRLSSVHGVITENYEVCVNDNVSGSNEKNLSCNENQANDIRKDDPFSSHVEHPYAASRSEESDADSETCMNSSGSEEDAKHTEYPLNDNALLEPNVSEEFSEHSDNDKMTNAVQSTESVNYMVPVARKHLIEEKPATCSSAVEDSNDCTDLDQAMLNSESENSEETTETQQWDNNGLNDDFVNESQIKNVSCQYMSDSKSDVLCP